MAEFDDKIERVLQAIEIRNHGALHSSGQVFADVEWVDELDRPVRPSDAGPGPLLMVFFRGFW